MKSSFRIASSETELQIMYIPDTLLLYESALHFHDMHEDLISMKEYQCIPRTSHEQDLS
jgi:hypothetical protein